MCVSAVFGQENTDTEKHRIAVYLIPSNNVDSEIRRVVNNQVINTLQKTGKYALIERNEAFITQIDKERGTQQSGRVLDNQITELGREFGAVAVCIVDAGILMGELSVDMRMVSVERATVIRSGSADGKYGGPSDIRKIVDRATADMFGEAPQGGGYSNNNNAPRGSRRNGEIYNPDGIELVYVEGTGSGIMAKSFYIGKYEVTQAQWRAIMGNNPSKFKGDKLPVENVSWNDVKEFITKLNAKTGRKYRLPTESEWEYAARGGNKSQGYEYSGSNNTYTVAWYDDNSNTTRPVGTKDSNELGIYDMSGNVWEWCEDCYNGNCSNRVLRGGSWRSAAQHCSVSDRIYRAPGYRYDNVGFRLVIIP